MKYAILITLLIASPAFAQERTAGGSLGQEASWTALQSRITKTDGDVSVLKIDVNAMKTCAAQKKLWLPGTGCVDGSMDLSELNRIKTCNANNKFYNPTAAGADAAGCYAPTATVPTTPAPTCTTTGSIVQRYRPCPAGSTNIGTVMTGFGNGDTFKGDICLQVVCQ